MEHARAGSHDDHEDDRKPRAHVLRGDCEESGLAKGTNERQYRPKQIEFRGLVPHERQQPTNSYDCRMYACICPTSDGVHRGVFPGLQPVAMIQVM